MEHSLSQIISYNADGRMNSILSRLLDLGASQGKLDELVGPGRSGPQGDTRLEGRRRLQGA